MTVSYPRTNLFSGIELTSCKFRLNRQQEMSRKSSGEIRVKDLGPPLWTAEVETGPLNLSTLSAFEARIDSLQGGAQTFLLSDARHPYPSAHPAGGFSDVGEIVEITGGGNRIITVDNLATGITLSEGDYLSFTYASGKYALHRVIDGDTTDGTGEMSVQVEPYVRAGALAGDPVKLIRPQALFMLDPGSVSTVMIGGLYGSVSFSAWQVIE